MGPKTESVEKVIAFQYCLKVASPAGLSDSEGRASGPTRPSGSEGWGFALTWKSCRKAMSLIKDALCLYSELRFPPLRGQHFHESHENMAGNEK